VLFTAKLEYWHHQILKDMTSLNPILEAFLISRRLTKADTDQLIG
jgi:hypothetical protein